VGVVGEKVSRERDRPRKGDASGPLNSRYENQQLRIELEYEKKTHASWRDIHWVIKKKERCGPGERNKKWSTTPEAETVRRVYKLLTEASGCDGGLNMVVGCGW